MTIRWLQPGHWICLPENLRSHWMCWSQCGQENLNSLIGQKIRLVH